MKQKIMILVIITITICLFVFSLPIVSSASLHAEPQSTSTTEQKVQDQIKLAVLNALANQQLYVQKGLVSNLQVTEIQESADKQWATAWVVYYDPQTDAIIPSEPAIPVVHLVNNLWQVYLPSDPGWENALTSTPDDLVTKSSKEMWVSQYQTAVESFPTQSGYFLPWHGGQTAKLSRSVGHDISFPSGTSHFAFDFFTGSNFGVYASRAGTIWVWNDSVANDDHSDVNFIVIQNADDPTLFQLYMHLAQGSIPPALKSVGAPVARGQFIAVADNTGNSTGTHLHFQVEHKPYWPSAKPYWNTALDVTFDDVDINGGRPRSSYYDPAYCLLTDICAVFQTTYTSGNYYLGDSTPPNGGLTGVNTGDVINTQTLTLSGWGSDDQSGLDYGQLKAYFNDSWHNLGPHFNPSFTYTWDFCDPQMTVPNGPVSVELLLYDVAGNPAPNVGLHHFIQNYACPVPPPSCFPSSDQVTLFEDAYYKGGCVKYNVGYFPTGSSLDPLGNDDAESLMVGSNVIATLYSEENYTGHSQAFITDTAYMQYQWVAANMASSMKVTSRQAPPQAPIPILPTPDTIFREGDVIPISWLNGGGATEYQVEIYLDSNLVRSLSWQSTPVGYVDSLSLGAYTWRVRARNDAGASLWSAQIPFSIQSPMPIPIAETVPYSDTMETTQAKWVHSTSGYWSYIDNSTKAHSGSRSWWYQNSVGDYNDNNPNFGSLTSPRISISARGYYLRFYYRYQTETHGTTWDQRWVQISEDGGPFINRLQLYADPQIPETSSWLRIKAIDLSEFVGHIIRVRFQFTTFDSANNNYAGWGIDDFSITATPPPACNENRQDDTPAQAFLLTYDPSITVPGEICPNGDVDYFKFYGSAGDQIVAAVDAMKNGSLLDSYLYLIASDGQTVLAENDDEVYGVIRDPLLSYKLTENGVYYLKLKAWKHPLVGGNDYFYTIRLYTDATKPNATLTWPASNVYLPDTLWNVTSQVNEVVNGVDRVEFYWHPTDWSVAGWNLFGTLRDGKNGWNMQFDPSGQPEGNDAAVYVRVYDMAGNFTDLAAWNLGIDKTPPTTAMLPLAPTQPSNAFLLQWTGADNLSGIAYFEIQESINGGNWTTLPQIDGSTFSYWIIGDPGNSYAFRMHAIDHSGNTENYPATAETGTSIPAATTLCKNLDAYDTSGNDNSPANASEISLDGASQIHNLCNPLLPGYTNDQDWILLEAVSGQQYFINSHASSQPSATVISLFAQDGTTLLAEATPHTFGVDTHLGWISDRDAPVYIRLRDLDGRVIGSGVGGTISVKTGHSTFLPIVNHR